MTPPTRHLLDDPYRSDADAQLPLSLPRAAPINLLPLRIETRFVKVIKDAAAALILAAMGGGSSQMAMRTASTGPSRDAQLAAALELAREAEARKAQWLAEVDAHEATLRDALREADARLGGDLSLMRRGQRRLRGRLTALDNQLEAHASDDPRRAQESRWTEGRRDKALAAVRALSAAVDLSGLSPREPASTTKARQDALADALNAWVDLLRRVPNRHNPELRPFAREARLIERAREAAEQLQALIDHHATRREWAERAARVSDMGRYLGRYGDRVEAVAPEALRVRRQLEARVTQEEERAQRRDALLSTLSAQLEQELEASRSDLHQEGLRATLRLAEAVRGAEDYDARVDPTQVEALKAEALTATEQLAEGSRQDSSTESAPDPNARTTASADSDGVDLTANDWDEELWIRVYPDALSVDRLETRLTDDEARDGQAFWIRSWFAFGDRARRLAAWRGLVARHGSQRATWISRATRPSAPLPGPLGGDETGYDPANDAWGARLWAAMARAWGDTQAWQEAWRSFAGALGEEHARVALRRSAPEDLGEQMLQACRRSLRGVSEETPLRDTPTPRLATMTSLSTERASTESASMERRSSALNLSTSSLEAVSLSDTTRDRLDGGRLHTLTPVEGNPSNGGGASSASTTAPVLPPSFPALDTRAPGEQRPATAPLMPERFVFRLSSCWRNWYDWHTERFRDGGLHRKVPSESDHESVDILGALIPQPLVAGPDLSQALLDASGAFNGDAGARWMVDFEQAVAMGMAIRVQLNSPSAQHRTFTRVEVLGVRGDAVGEALGELLEHHACAGKGAEILPTGTPTNNTGGSDSGVRFERTPVESFDAEHEGPLFAPSEDRLRRRDGDWLARTLGVSPARLQQLRGADGDGLALATAMNRALFPGTIGAWLERMLYVERHEAPRVLKPDMLEHLRRFFVDHVRGRGSAPVLRVGRQPYGVLPMSRLRDSWLGRAPASEEEAVQETLHVLLRRLGWRWTLNAPVDFDGHTIWRSGPEEAWLGRLARLDRFTLNDPLEPDELTQELPWSERSWTRAEPDTVALMAQRRFLRLLGQRAVSPELHHRYGVQLGRGISDAWDKFVDDVEEATGQEWDELLKFFKRPYRSGYWGIRRVGRQLLGLLPEVVPETPLVERNGDWEYQVPEQAEVALEAMAIGDVYWLRSHARVLDLVGDPAELSALIDALPSQWMATPPSADSRPLALLLRHALIEASWDACAQAWEDKGPFDARAAHHPEGADGATLAADWRAAQAAGADLAALYQALRESYQQRYENTPPSGPLHRIARFAIHWGEVQDHLSCDVLRDYLDDQYDVGFTEEGTELRGLSPSDYVGSTEHRDALPQGVDLAADLADVLRRGLDLLDLARAYYQSWQNVHAGGSWPLRPEHRVARYVIDWEKVLSLHDQGIEPDSLWMEDKFTRDQDVEDSLHDFPDPAYLLGNWNPSDLFGVTWRELLDARAAIVHHDRHLGYVPWPLSIPPTHDIVKIAKDDFAWGRLLDDVAHLGPLHPLCLGWHQDGWPAKLPELFGVDPEPFLMGNFKRARWRSFVTELPRGGPNTYDQMNNRWDLLDAVRWIQTHYVHHGYNGSPDKTGYHDFDRLSELLEEKAAFASRAALMGCSSRDLDLSNLDLPVSDLLFANARLGRQVGRLAQLSESIEAARLLAEQPAEALDLALREHLDLSSHRLDAWVLGLVQQRLEAQRAAKPGVYVGAYGWVEDLRQGGKRLDRDGDEVVHSFAHPQINRPAQDADNQGFILAPSLNQAMTGAVLRAACLGRTGSAARVNLSSARARGALDLIDGVRQGQRLGALLGYAFERRLHALNPALNAAVRSFRRAYPLEGDPSVVDGLALARRVRAGGHFPLGASGSYSPQERADGDAALDHLLGLLDAVGDLLLAESMHQALQGRYERAGAVLKVLSEGAPPPQEFEVLRTPRRSHSLEHRVAWLRPAVAPAADAWGRAKAEPVLEAWAAEQLPPLEHVRAVVLWPDAPRPQSTTTVIREDEHDLDGRLIDNWRGRSLSVSAAELGLGALDLVRLVGGLPMSEDGALARRLLLAAKKQLMAEASYAPIREVNADGGWVSAVREAPAPPTLQLHMSLRDASWGEEVLSFAELQPLAESLHQLLAQARPLAAGDLRRNVDVDGLTEDQRARWDLVDLRRRAQALRQELIALRAQLDQRHASLPVSLYERLAAFDMPELIPSALNPFDPENHGAHKQLRATAHALVDARLAEAERAERALHDAVTPHASAEAAQALARALMGRDFTLLPVFTLADPAELALALQQSPALLPSSEPLALERWMHGVALVHEPLRPWEAARMYGELVHGEVDALRPVQLPVTSGEPWLGLEFDPQQVNLDEERLSLVLDAPADLNPSARVAGLRLHAWVEALPERKASAGVAFHYDQPNAEAPQAVLVAVHSRPEGEATGGSVDHTWSWDELFGVLDATRTLMRLRALEPDQLQPWATGPEVNDRYVHPLFQALPAAMSQVPLRDDELGVDFGLSTGITALDPSATHG